MNRPLSHRPNTVMTVLYISSKGVLTKNNKRDKKDPLRKKGKATKMKSEVRGGTMCIRQGLIDDSMNKGSFLSIDKGTHFGVFCCLKRNH